MVERQRRVMVSVETNGDHVVIIRANKRQRRLIAAVVILAVFHFTGYGVEKGLAAAKWVISLAP